AVAIENAGGGSANAAPLARNVMDFYFDELKPARALKLAQAQAAASSAGGSISSTTSSSTSSPMSNNTSAQNTVHSSQ
ncbi:MAG: penicillin-binding protein 2, partial [Gammaproteobacteria bacterium]